MYINRWIDTHAQVRPDHRAVVDTTTNSVHTYRDLRQASLRRAGQLLSLGVEPGDRVAVYAGNRVEILELLLACARLGACLVPLNTRLSLREVEQILGDCSPKVLFLDPDMAAGIEHPRRVMLLPEVSGELPAAELMPVDPETAVAIFYTGGTTGVPKGAVLTHRSLQWNAFNTITGWGLSPDDVAPLFTPMFHTGGLNVLATPLLCLGATLVLPGAFEPGAALDIIEREQCTLVFMVPTMFDMLRNVPGFSAARLSRVRRIISGGAPCPRPLFDAYWDLGLPLTQGYGLTEAGPNTFGVSLEQARAKPGTVGVPLAYVDLKLVNATGQECAPGEVGELVVGGPHIMSGYFNRPNETAAVLKDGWLKTGDLAYRDADGFYFICGRSKEMFISGGENVFPAEIEEVLLSHPDVAEAAVVGVPHPKWGEVGRAYLVPKANATLSPEALVEHCQSSLARYKVPKEFVLTDSLPKSAAGKVLKRALLERSA